MYPLLNGIQARPLLQFCFLQSLQYGKPRFVQTPLHLIGLPLIQLPAGQSQQEGFIAFAGFTHLACVFGILAGNGR
jgi:hypothetical protein